MFFMSERTRRFILQTAPVLFTAAFVVLCLAFPRAALAAVEKNSDPLFQDPGEEGLFSGFSLNTPIKIVGVIILVVLIITMLLRARSKAPQNKNRVSSKDLGPPPPPPGSTLRQNDKADARSDVRPDARSDARPSSNPDVKPEDETRQNPWPKEQPKKPAAPSEKPGMKDLAARRWASYSSKPPEKPAPEAPKATVDLNARPDATFNQESFLEGARVLYSRLQEAWAARDVDNLATFTTPEMQTIIKEQAAKDPTPQAVRILLVNATFEGMHKEGSEEIATVRFETMLCHGNDPNAAPVEVRERWHFSRRLGWNVNWLLDGIEPI